MDSKRTAEINCKQVIYPGYHLLPSKIWHKRYDQYSDLKQSKKCNGPQTFVHPKHHRIPSTSILHTMVHHNHPPYYDVTSKHPSPSSFHQWEPLGNNLSIQVNDEYQAPESPCKLRNTGISQSSY